MAETQVKKGDRYPALESTLSEGGKAINLKSPIKAVGVKLRIKKVSPAETNAEVKTAGFLEEGEHGVVVYKWTKADTENALPLNVLGEYRYEWVVEWTAEKSEHFPTKGFKTFEVVEALT